MSNKPYYTASRQKKLTYVKEAFPNDRLIITMEQVYYKGAIKQSDFAVIIDTFLEGNRKNCDKMVRIVDEAEEK